ncbi:hypothetical protein ABPG72_016722 [Tetrahymena utriculariae]
MKCSKQPSKRILPTKKNKWFFLKIQMQNKLPIPQFRMGKGMQLNYFLQNERENKVIFIILYQIIKQGLLVPQQCDEISQIYNGALALILFDELLKNQTSTNQEKANSLNM